MHDAAADARPIDAPAAVEPADGALTLTAICAAGETAPSRIGVELVLPLRGRPVFRIDDSADGDAGIVATLSDLALSDAGGAVPFGRRMSGEALEVVPRRAVRGPVTLSYRASSLPLADHGSWWGVRHDDVSIGGAGRHFLIVPDDVAPHRVRVTWQPPACAKAGKGYSSFPGDVAVVDSVQELLYASYFWGKGRGARATAGGGEVLGVWFGDIALDVAAATSYAAEVYAAERAFFGDADASPYTVFARVIPEQHDHSNGIGQPHSFLLAIGPTLPWAAHLRTNIAHEMFHRWFGMRTSIGEGLDNAWWFSEGFTVYYANVIPFRHHLIGPDEFVANLNVATTKHFANKYRHATNAAIRAGFASNADLQRVPYSRGALYAAELDAAIRAASRGKRSLDDLVVGLYRAGEPTHWKAPLKPAAFTTALERELGAAAVARFHAVIEDGATPNPPTGAYGPCFTRHELAGGAFEWARVPGIADQDCQIDTTPR